MSRRPLIWITALVCAGLAIGGVSILFGKKQLWVGSILPLTGPNASIGLGMRNSLRLAIDEVNRRGGVQGHKIGLVDLDDASLPATAAVDANLLAEDQRILGAVVHYDHDCSTASKVTLSDARVPHILGAITTHEIPDTIGDWEFRLLPHGTEMLTPAFAYAWDILGARKFYYVDDHTTEGREKVWRFRDAMGKRFETSFVGNELFFKPGDSDFSAVVERLRTEAPDFIVFGGRAHDAGLFVKQLREGGVKAPVLAQSHELSQQFIEAAQDKAEGALQIFDGLPLEETAEGKSFLAAYQAAGFREPPGPFGIFAYVEMQALLGAMEKSFLTRPSVRGALANEQFETGLGPVRFFYLGSTYQHRVLYQVIHGHWTPIYTTDAKGALQPLPHP